MVYVSQLLDDIPATVKSTSVWSDGPSSQFQNSYIAVSIHTLEEKHGIKILSNIMCGTAVKTRKVIVNDAAAFVLACNAPE